MFPILFESSYFTLYSYPLFMGLAWGFGYFFTQNIFEKYQQSVKPLFHLFLGLFVASFLGAKLFFLWFSSGPKIYQYIYAQYFWLGGGFVFYGGLILGLIYYFLYSLIFKKFDFKLSSLLLPGLVFGHAIGRVGCFLTGCCFGSQTDIPWAVAMAGESRHPVQLYEAISLFFMGMMILQMLKTKKNNQVIIASYLMSYAVIRFILEFFRGDEIRGIIANHLSSSQLVSIAILILGLVIFFLQRKGEIQASQLPKP